MITGAMAAGPKNWMMIGGHIVQSILKGRLFQQVSREIKELQEKGKIPDDFADEKKYKYGLKSRVELLSVIEKETPDPALARNCGQSCDQFPRTPGMYFRDMTRSVP